MNRAIPAWYYQAVKRAVPINRAVPSADWATQPGRPKWIVCVCGKRPGASGSQCVVNLNNSNLNNQLLPSRTDAVLADSKGKQEALVAFFANREADLQAPGEHPTIVANCVRFVFETTEFTLPIEPIELTN